MTGLLKGCAKLLKSHHIYSPSHPKRKSVARRARARRATLFPSSIPTWRVDISHRFLPSRRHNFVRQYTGTILRASTMCKGALYDTCMAVARIQEKWEKGSRFPCVARIDSSRIALDGAAYSLRWFRSIFSRTRYFGDQWHGGATRKGARGYFTCAGGLPNHTGCS